MTDSKHTECPDDECRYYDPFFDDNCGGQNMDNCLMEKTDGGAKLACSDVLFAELSLMLDVFNSCIETKTLPGKGSPCQKNIIELLDQCGKKPTALRVRGT